MIYAMKRVFYLIALTQQIDACRTLCEIYRELAPPSTRLCLDLLYRERDQIGDDVIPASDSLPLFYQSFLKC
jgi:hypothetical protein